MPRRLVVLVCCVAAISLTLAGGAHTPRLARLDTNVPLPADFIDPESTTTWDLSSVTLQQAPELATDGSPGLPPTPRSWVNVAHGTVVLPWGSRDVTLQRGTIDDEDRTLVHRWLDPRYGVVAQISGPSTADGLARNRVEEASLLDGGIDDAANLKIYVDELDGPVIGTPGAGLNLGWDFAVDPNDPDPTEVADMLVNNEGISVMADVIALDYWDFSGNTNGTEVRQVNVTLTANETCNAGECGFDLGDKLGRQDRFGTPMVFNAQVTELEDRSPADFTIWLRAGVQNEGSDDCFGSGESRFCYEGNDTSGNGVREQVPLWRFDEMDADGWFLNVGDSWSSNVFDCDQNLFNYFCGADKNCLFESDEIESNACGSRAGTQSSEVLKGGVVKLPSGHRMNTLLVRTAADFCTYGSTLGENNCVFLSTEVLTAVYLWQAPHVGTLALFQTPSPPDTQIPDLVNWSVLDETNINFGLLPPLTVAVRNVTANSVELWWDPGQVTSHIKDYVVYWDTDSGASSSYANSTVVAGPPATIGSLSAGTTYFFTIVTRADYTNPSTSAVTTMESLLFPKQVTGDPGHTYPIEVTATTSGGACNVATSIANLTVDKTQDGGCQLCWDASVDPCVQAYDIFAAPTPELPGNFESVSQTGLQTCWTGAPSGNFFLVRGRGTGGVGP